MIRHASFATTPIVRVSPLLPWIAIALFGAGCSHVDVKGREVLRLGPLRGVPIVAASVSPTAIDVDAGTDALTDEELRTISAALPAALGAAFDRLADQRGARRVGEAHVDSCRLRAGPGQRVTLYVARCVVHVDVDGEPLIEVHAEALRRTPAKAISADQAARIKKLERNPLLLAEDSRLALEGALEAAALLIVDGALPAPADGPPQPRVVPLAEKAALARDRLARGGNTHAALFDLRTAGAPADAQQVLPFLDNPDPAIRAAAVDALGELCAPWTLERVEPLTIENADDEAVRRSAVRALSRLRACSKLGALP